MAKVSNWYTDTNGNYVVKYTDGTTRVLTQLQAIQENVIKDPGTLGADKTTGQTTGGTVVGYETGKTTTPQTQAAGPGSYGTDMGGAFAQDPTTGQYYNTSNTVPIVGPDGKTQNVPISIIIQRDVNDPKRLGEVRKALIENGLITKGTKSKQAITNAYVSVLVSAAATSMNPNDWMKQFKAFGGGFDVKESKLPLDQVNIRKYEKSTIQPIAEQIYIKLAGRVPTAKEVADLTKGLNLKEKDIPTTTSYKKKNGKLVATTSGGVDEQQYIAEQAKQAPGYQETQKLNFESWLMGALTNRGA